MSDQAHLSGYHYARITLEEFKNCVAKCERMIDLNTIKRQIDGAILCITINPRLIKLYGDIYERRKTIDAAWEKLRQPRSAHVTHLHSVSAA